MYFTHRLTVNWPTDLCTLYPQTCAHCTHRPVHTVPTDLNWPTDLRTLYPQTCAYCTHRPVHTVPTDLCTLYPQTCAYCTHSPVHTVPTDLCTLYPQKCTYQMEGLGMWANPRHVMGQVMTQWMAWTSSNVTNTGFLSAHLHVIRMPYQCSARHFRNTVTFW
jgi:hypothetical protein